MRPKLVTTLRIALASTFLWSMPLSLAAQSFTTHPATTSGDPTLEPLFLPVVSYIETPVHSTPTPTPPPSSLAASHTDGRIAKDLARRWALDDAVVANGAQQRVWYWGSQVLTSGEEPWVEALGGKRVVWYFDKARMEITNPSANPDNPGYVTSGLLVDEMVGGYVQLGNAKVASRSPAEIAIVGDPVAPTQTITYRDLRPVATIAGDNRSASRPDQAIVEVLGKNGVVRQDIRFATYNVRTGAYNETKGHNIAKVFTDAIPLDQILNLAGPPVSEPYWVTVPVAGTPTDVLIQLFDRRALTYTPSNAIWSRVEWGNVGRHYAQWRYGSATNIAPRSPLTILDAQGAIRGLSEISPDAVQWAMNRPSTDAVAVFNMNTGALYGYNPGVQFPMYSTVKVPIMLTLLDQVMRAGRQLTAEEDMLVRKMIQLSDNDATSTLYYQRIGGEAGVEGFLRRHGILNTDMSPNRWGLSTTTVTDMARLMGKLGNCTILNRTWCTYAIDIMRNVDASQYWGVSAGVPNVLTTRTVALKNGWFPESGWLASGVDLSADAIAPAGNEPSRAPLGYAEDVPWPASPNNYTPDATGWAIHSIGFAKDAGKLYAVAVYTRPSSTMEYGVQTVEGFARSIYPGVPAR